MTDFEVVGWKLSDFAGALADPGNATMTTGDFAVGSSATLDSAAGTVAFRVRADDGDADDAEAESRALSALCEDLDLNGVTYPAGSKIAAEFVLTTNDAPAITFVVARIGTGPGTAAENLIVFPSAPLAPGRTYRFSATADGPAEPRDTICFASGTLIDTPDGPCPVESLEVGDRVVTRDHGQQPVRWVGARALSSWDLLLNPHVRPIRIMAPDPSADDLVVSPQHRVLVGGWKAELLFGAAEVLAPAKALCNGRNVFVDHRISAVSYHHLLLPVHALVRANGQWAESLHTGPVARRAIDPEGRAEFDFLFPEADLQTGDCALPALTAREAALLA